MNTLKIILIIYFVGYYQYSYSNSEDDIYSESSKVVRMTFDLIDSKYNSIKLYSETDDVLNESVTLAKELMSIAYKTGKSGDKLNCNFLRLSTFLSETAIMLEKYNECDSKNCRAKREKMLNYTLDLKLKKSLFKDCRMGLGSK